MKRVKLILLVLVVLSGLSATGLALAQASLHNDLGCWGVLTNGGGSRQSTTVRLTDALGQPTGGQSQSASYRLRGGYSQNWGLLSATPTPAPTVQAPTGVYTNYLPYISKFIRTVRACR